MRPTSRVGIGNFRIQADQGMTGVIVVKVGLIDKDKVRGRGQNFMQGQRDRKQDLYCTYCKKSRHTIADCYKLKIDLKARGYRIDRVNGSQNFGKTMPNQQGQGRRWNNGGNGRNRGNGRQGFGNRDRFNMMTDEDETDRWC